MSTQPRTPINLTLAIDAADAQQNFGVAVTSWLDATYKIPLASAQHDDLLIDWRTKTAPERTVAHLLITDANEQVKRSVSLVADDVGALVFVEEMPLLVADTSRAPVDVSESTHALVNRIVEQACSEFQGLDRRRLNASDSVESEALLEALLLDLSPGLLIIVTTDDGTVSIPQRALADHLAALPLAVAMRPDEAALVVGRIGVTGQVRPGSAISIARSEAGLDAQSVGAMSLRSQPDSARRLFLRHQLAAPLPFSAQRRRALGAAFLISGVRELDVSAAIELMEEADQRTSELQQRLNDLELTLELSWEEQDASLSELDSALSRLRFLERAFRQYGELPVGEPEPDDNWGPDSCHDSVAAARELLPYLVVSSLEDPVRQLDQHQKKAIWAKKIWSALRAMNDYVRSKSEERFSGDLAKYREDPPSEAVPLLAEFASKESESTSNNPSLRLARTFRVPAEIDPTCQVFMEQHIKIDRGGSNAPRIHILDDTAGPTKRIHVGYIGPHLPTSSGF